MKARKVKIYNCEIEIEPVHTGAIGKVHCAPAYMLGAMDGPIRAAREKVRIVLAARLRMPENSVALDWRKARACEKRK